MVAANSLRSIPDMPLVVDRGVMMAVVSVKVYLP